MDPLAQSRGDLSSLRSVRERLKSFRSYGMSTRPPPKEKSSRHFGSWLRSSDEYLAWDLFLLFDLRLACAKDGLIIPRRQPQKVLRRIPMKDPTAKAGQAVCDHPNNGFRVVG